MHLVHHLDGLPEALRGSVVAIGNFDGVHLGHQQVIAAAKAKAAGLGAPTAVLSFEPHPRQLFQPDLPPFRLTPFRIRARLIEALGIDLHAVMTFDRAFAAQTAEAFIERILVAGFGARHVVIGFDFCFGKDRQGNAATLSGYGERYGFGVTVVTQASDERGGAYSSTRIREHLAAGRMRDAADLLGRAWEIEGRVQHGDKRGRHLGYPTANVELADYLRPAFGIYAVEAAVDRGDADALTWHGGVANLGIRPMFETPTPLLEVHLFDFADDLYGRHLRVRLIEHLRGEAKFDGVDALVAQMDRDTAAARAVLADRRTGHDGPAPMGGSADRYREKHP